VIIFVSKDSREACLILSWRGKVSERTYLCDDGAGANDGSFADDAVGEDNRVAADEDVVFDYDRAACE